MILSARGVRAHLLTGELANAAARRQMVEDLNAGRVKVLSGHRVSSSGKGFDCKALSTLFHGHPHKIQWPGPAIPGEGPHGQSPGKARARVYDYVDVHVGVLKASAAATAEGLWRSIAQ